MGHAKSFAGMLEDIRGLAESLAIETGAAEECPHGYTIGAGDEENARRAYIKASALLASGKAQYPRRELLDAIKAVSNDTCAACEDRDRE